MENLINSIITLDNNEKYIVINQAIYQGKNYFLVAKVTEDEEEVTDEIKFLQSTEIDGKNALELVTDEKIIELLSKYFKPQE